MRKSVIILVLCSLFVVPSFAQEAFYIYRNDGDFNGFFYDEVIEMRQSKIGVDSIEYDHWVTQEVVLADTTYRIPLAAIDSIGFQQPEIKLNPNVKFMERDGLAPYFTSIILNYATNNHSYCFLNLPSDLVPKPGDVLIGLHTDSIAAEKYASVGGSFGCVVERVDVDANGLCTVRGHRVEQVEDVFEQYITVEKLTVDQAGKMQRRIAGCTPEGLPRTWGKVEGQGDATIIDFTSTLAFDIPIRDSTMVKLSADVNLKFGTRVQYKIRWGHFFVKLTNELSTSVKPSFSMSATAEVKEHLSKFVPLPDGIPFPATCPIFELCPMPTLFFFLSGTVEAKLNMPKVGLGMAQDIIINTDDHSFPISSSIYLTEPNPEEDEDLLDLSAEFSVDATLHTGMEFQMSINTASWFSSILKAGIGLHFYAGPKVNAHASFKLSFLTENDYTAHSLLSNGSISISKLGLSFEAGARSKVAWYDENEVTFLSASKDLFKTTLRLAPTFKKTETEVAGNYLVVTLRPNTEEEDQEVALFKNMRIAIADNNSGSNQTITTFGDWNVQVVQSDPDFYSMTIPLDQLKILKPGKYQAMPLLSDADHHEIKAYSASTIFDMPMMLEWDEDSTLHFPDYGGKQTIRFATNCPPEMLLFKGNESVSYESLTATKDNDSIYHYEFTCKASPNMELFNNRTRTSGQTACPYVTVKNGTMAGAADRFYIGVSQDDNNLEDAQIACYGSFKMSPDDNDYYSVNMNRAKMTISRTDSVTIEIERNDVSSDGNEYTTLILILRDTTRNDSAAYEQSLINSYSRFRATGTLEKISMTSNMSEKTTLEFEQIDGYSRPGVDNLIEGMLSKGRYLRITANTDGTYDTIQHVMSDSTLSIFRAIPYLKRPVDPTPSSAE